MHLWVVLVGIKLDLRLITLIKSYPTFYMAIGGQEVMDEVALDDVFYK